MPSTHEPRLNANNRIHACRKDKQEIAEWSHHSRLDRDAKRRQYGDLPRARCFCPGFGRWIWADVCDRRKASRGLVKIIKEQCDNCERGR